MEKNEKGSRISRAGMNFWIDVIAFLIFVICAISGYAIMEGEHIRPSENSAETELINANAFWGIGLFIWAHLHNFTGWMLVALVIVHLITHRRWISMMISRSIRPGR
jgi:hypothetical protein